MGGFFIRRDKTVTMYNWSTDEKELMKNKEKHAIWKLEQMVNFGLGGEKISEGELKKYWERLTLDPKRRKFFELLLYGN